ncbi:MAG: MltA domain-containing protein [Alphaproteobacteria bacterium]|nr:MltA domain-containing protein [Alphaproteobacteria bacterium]
MTVFPPARSLARAAALVLVSAALTACATTTTKPPTPQPPKPEPPVFTLRPVTFAELPGWKESDLGPALQAFKASCAAVVRRPADQKLGRFSPYGGTVGEWAPACAAAALPDAAGARSFFERWFIPNAVDARADQMSKLTAYYEPVIQARRTPQPGFTEPFLPRPDDLVSIDLAAFDEQQGLAANITEDVLKGIANDVPDPLEPVIKDKLGERLTRRFRTPVWGRLTEKRVEPYPARAALGVTTRPALAYAHPVDVYDTQVQGSARVQFEDGAQMRMAYNSQNGWKWNSVYGQLRTRGDIAAANKRAVRAWMDTQPPEAVRAALDLDPSYIFFALEPIGDPTLGPKGAQGVPLTALGSLAVDPTAHPYGALIFADAATGDGVPFQRLLVAQDTGGAIRRGPLRGDVFWGTGDAAGAGAEKMNGPVRFWTLLPNPAAALVSDARAFRETPTSAAR